MRKIIAAMTIGLVGVLGVAAVAPAQAGETTSAIRWCC